MLDRGRCQFETWFGRADTERGLFAAPACRVGALEVGLNLERRRAGGEHRDAAALQLKWATEVDGAVLPLSLGLVLAAGRELTGGAGTAWALVAPLTLRLAGDRLQLHFNAGIDHPAVDGHRRRWGLAADWSVDDAWLLTVERRRQQGEGLTRLGLRRQIDAMTSLDLSRARVAGERLWVVGLNVEWGR